MTKLITLIILVAVIPLSTRAQSTDFEIIAGTNWSTLKPNSENTSDYSPKAGITAGVGMNRYFDKGISLGVRLLYQRETVRGYFPFKGGQSQGDVLLTTSFNKITLPIVMRYGYTLRNKITFTGEFGGFVSYQINESVKDNIPDDQVFQQLSQYTKQYTTFDAGIYLGLSGEIPITEKLDIKLLVFDNIGLVNISQIQYNQYQSFKSKSLGFAVGVVYKLH